MADHRVLVFGASIAQGYHDAQGGWADRLKRELLKRHKETAFFNLGIAGDQVKDVLARFNAEVVSRTKVWHSFDETTVIISVGTNDTYVESDKNEPTVSKNIFIEQFGLLIDQAESRAKNILVCSILPVDESRSTPVSWMNISYLNNIIEDYNVVLRQLCQERGVVYIDLNSEVKKLDWNNLLDDGVHPTAEGHEYICQKVSAVLLEQLDL
jgi:lysophospholipase L1-like esterase